MQPNQLANQNSKLKSTRKLFAKSVCPQTLRPIPQYQILLIHIIKLCLVCNGHNTTSFAKCTTHNLRDAIGFTSDLLCVILHYYKKFFMVRQIVTGGFFS